MSDVDKPFASQSDVAAQVLAIAAPKRQFTQTQIEGVTLWLEKELQRAIERQNAKPLTMRGVNQLEAAYLRFHNTIAELQSSDDPPPPLPMLEDGTTTWERWIAVNKTFRFPRGPLTKGLSPEGIRPRSDWRLIAALLALYETVSGKPPSGAQWDGPTMKFLQKALALLADGENEFNLPSADALRRQLPKLRQTYLAWGKQKLSEIISNAGA